MYYNALRKKLKEFESLRGKINEDKKDNLEESIQTIKSYLIKSYTIPETIEECLLSEYQNLIGSQNLWPLCETLAKHVNDDLPNFPYPDLHLTNNDLLELTHDFFKNATSKEIYQIFLKLFKQRKNIYFTDELDELNFHADSMFLTFDESFYLRMEKKNEFADIATMAHEFGHGIQFLINYNGTLLTTLYVFRELISTFFELLCTEYYTKDLTLGKKAIASNYEFWDITCENAFLLNKEFQILQSIKNNSNPDIISIKNYINFFIHHSDNDELVETIGIHPSDDFIYIIGYIFAIELYLIYKENPDYAFYLLKKIMAIDLRKDAKSYFKEIIDLGINPTSSLDSFESHLKRELIRL